MLYRAIVTSLTALIAVSTAGPVAATVTTLNFTSTGVATGGAGPIPGLAANDYTLTNTATGNSTVPAFMLNLGDDVAGTITFAHPVTVAASPYQNLAALFITLGSDATQIARSDYFANVNFYSGSTDVTPTLISDYTTGPFGFAGFNDGYLSGTASAFTFDKITYDLYYTGLLGADNKSVSSALISGSSADFVTYSVPAAVPELTTWAMLALGLGFVGGGLRHSQRSKQKLAVR